MLYSRSGVWTIFVSDSPTASFPHGCGPRSESARPNRPAARWSRPAFWACLATQFLTALNDNIFRWLVIGIGKDHVAAYADRRRC